MDSKAELGKYTCHAIEDKPTSVIVYSMYFDFVAKEVSNAYEEIVDLDEWVTTVKVYSKAAETMTLAEVIVLISR